MKTFHDFVVAVYAASEPSVNFDTVEGQINCTEHRISEKLYSALLDEFAGDDKDRILACNMFMLQSGPSLYASED